MKITREVFEQIRDTVGTLPAETGGLLAGPLEGPVTHFYFDEFGARGCAEYSPDTMTVNKMLKTWPDHIRLRGFVHSHPPRFLRPSSADANYAARILAHNKGLPELLLPIAQSNHDADEFELHGYAVEMRKGRPVVSSRTIEVLQGVSENLPVPFSTNVEMFDRVRNAYDLERMQDSLVLVAGVGGAASFVDGLARTGVGHFVLIDPDTVSVANLATQQYYRQDVGRPKVDALAERVRSINPDARLTTLTKRLEEVTLGEFQSILFARRYQAKLLVAMTDSFSAQATANRLALSLRLPLLAGQMYPAGRAAELVFTVPGATPACMRCVLSSRYAQYAGGYVNSVTSHDSPIFSGESLNSTAGAIALAILHHGTDNARWGTLIRRAGNRNFLQIRMCPDAGEHLHLNIFDRVLGKDRIPELFFGETLWRSVPPDNPSNGYPTCPDCGGTGDLLNPALGAGPTA